MDGTFSVAWVAQLCANVVKGAVWRGEQMKWRTWVWQTDMMSFFESALTLQVFGECFWYCSGNVVVLAAGGGAAQVWKHGWGGEGVVWSMMTCWIKDDPIDTQHSVSTISNLCIFVLFFHLCCVLFSDSFYLTHSMTLIYRTYEGLTEPLLYTNLFELSDTIIVRITHI